MTRGPTRTVARRELAERLRQRAFKLSTAAIVGVVAAIAILAGVLGGDGGAQRYTLAVDGAEATAIAAAAERTQEAFDIELDVSRADGPAAARAGVADGDYDAALTRTGLTVEDDPPDELVQALAAATDRVRAAAALRGAGLSAAEARSALDPDPLRVTTLEPGDDEGGSYGIALVASILLYGQLIVVGLAVAQGVVEEKASRVVEILLSTIPARPLLTGKVIGIGILGIGQLLLAGVVGLAAGAASGALSLDGSAVGALAVALLWFTFGYGVYASLYAIAGVVVSRQEDLSASSTPLTLLLVAAYLVVFPALDAPDSTLATVASLVPFSSPIVMPALVALGEASAVEIALSLAILVASTAVLLVVAGRIYERLVLRMGSPVRFSEAFRLARR
ncbi:MAG: ABC transporter permease [Solirubrobacterales bacterium]|nr:ABC transporter permease [Solirubrobacterales bacterium]